MIFLYSTETRKALIVLLYLGAVVAPTFLLLNDKHSKTEAQMNIYGISDTGSGPKKSHPRQKSLQLLPHAGIPGSDRKVLPRS